MLLRNLITSAESRAANTLSFILIRFMRISAETLIRSAYTFLYGPKSRVSVSEWHAKAVKGRWTWKREVEGRPRSIWKNAGPQRSVVKIYESPRPKCACTSGRDWGPCRGEGREQPRSRDKEEADEDDEDGRGAGRKRGRSCHGDHQRRRSDAKGWSPLLPATLLHWSHREPENRFPPEPVPTPRNVSVLPADQLGAETIFEIERTPKEDRRLNDSGRCNCDRPSRCRGDFSSLCFSFSFQLEATVLPSLPRHALCAISVGLQSAWRELLFL